MGFFAGIVSGLLVGLLTHAMIEKGDHTRVYDFFKSGFFKLALRILKLAWRILCWVGLVFVLGYTVFGGVFAAGMTSKMMSDAFRGHMQWSWSEACAMIAVTTFFNLALLLTLNRVRSRYQRWRLSRRAAAALVETVDDGIVI